MNSEDKASPVNQEGQFLNSLPAWFAVGAALIYAAGFLVEFTFLNFMGVRNTGSEIFKAKYIYVGLLCILFPICITLIVVSGWRMWRVWRAFKRSLKKVTVKDVKNLDGLVEKFKKPADEVSKYLVQQFSEDTSKAIESFTGQDEAEIDNMRFLLLKDINVVIRDKELYDKERFAAFELSWGTKALRDQNPHGSQRRKFNRLLIGEAYSKEIETRLKPIGFKAYLPSLLLLFLLVLVTYLMIAFSRPGMGDFKGNEPWYAAFFMTAILGLIIPRRLEVALDRWRKERP